MRAPVSIFNGNGFIVCGVPKPKFTRCITFTLCLLIFTDLLEKNRVIHQGSKERNYHIFYQMLYATTDEDLANLCLLSRDAAQYGFLAKGVAHVDRLDDHEEYGMTENAIKVLGFTVDERNSMFKVCAAILNFSNMKFKQKPRDEQAEVVDPAGKKICILKLEITRGKCALTS